MPNVQDSEAVRQKYGLSLLPNTPQGVKAHNVDEGQQGGGGGGCRERAIICNTLQHITRELLDEMLAGQLCCVTNDHPWLRPLLVSIEIALLHKCINNVDAMWGCIVRVCADQDAINNVHCFPGVVTAIGQLRLWVLFSLINKTLPKQLKEICRVMATIGDASAGLLPNNLEHLGSILSALEPLEFSLIINEADIVQDDFKFDWKELFVHNNEDLLNFQLFHLTLPLSSLHGIRQPGPKVDELQGTLRSQISQRAYYQQECIKLQKEMTELKQQLKTLVSIDPKEIVGLRIACLEERLKTSELVRSQQRLTIEKLKKRIHLLQQKNEEEKR